MDLTTLLTQIAPIFAVIAVGAVAARWDRFSETAAATLNDLVYYLALPALIFDSVAEADLSAGVSGVAIAVAAGVLLVGYVLGVGAARLLRMPLREANAVGTVGAWGNVGYLGIPLAVAVLGPATGFAASLVSTIHTALAISVFLVAATLIDRDRGSRGLLVRTVARRVLGNPIVIAIVLGLLVAASGWRLPHPVATTVALIGAMAAPGGLFALGILLRGAVPALRGGRAGGIVVAVVLKLVVIPALAVAAVHVFAVPAPWAAVLVLMCALPDAATVFVLMAQYRTWYRESTAAVVLTTVGSIVTLPVVLTLAL
ncbi:AEC family transporter [Actinomycetospora termitidis]|uniref:AEC family transporter n=1 Tax=Actinomycetospora termitidis TaxID=3053470 RepID=A0ABT7M1P5_9PSEU|nr:AEC family transporter [Actinomycetospora sp. Odt1-22]MDL5154583.1 AEC family transporter [Actinomycetospora sp. Odt1-22]